MILMVQKYTKSFVFKNAIDRALCPKPCALSITYTFTVFHFLYHQQLI